MLSLHSNWWSDWKKNVEDSCVCSSGMLSFWVTLEVFQEVPALEIVLSNQGNEKNKLIALNVKNDLIPYSSKSCIHKISLFLTAFKLQHQWQRNKKPPLLLRLNLCCSIQMIYVKNEVWDQVYAPLIYWHLPSKYIKKYVHSLSCQSGCCGVKHISQMLLLDNTVGNT